MKTMISYQKYIDGLRGFAISLVIFYHYFSQFFFKKVFNGGFIGVDIFFVISGFLISSIIFINLESNSFSLLDFYSRRIKRIFPALIIVLFSSLILGFFVFLSEEFKQLGKHVFGSSLFINNYMYLFESGYFDTTGITKPLLHLWSLAIEEQYYLVWPLILWISYKHRLNFIFVIFFLFIASFGINLFYLSISSVKSFYLSYCRFFELLAGSLIAAFYICKNNQINLLRSLLIKLFSSKYLNLNKNFYKHIVSLIGLILILIGIFLIDPSKKFPGWQALTFPVFGTCLVICSSKDSFVNKFLFSNKILVWIGLISYPLYLWHWILLSFSYVFQSHPPTISYRLFLLLLSIFLSFFTYKFIEIPIRFYSKGQKIVVLLIALLLVFGITGYITYVNEGFPSRTVFIENGESRKANNFDVRITQIKNCPISSDLKVNFEFKLNCGLHINQTATKKIIVWGDSHADAWRPVLTKIAKDNNYNLFLISHPGCPPVVNTKRTDGIGSAKSGWSFYNCTDINEKNKILEAIINLKPDVVILMAKWDLYSNGMRAEGQEMIDQQTHFLTSKSDGNDATQSTSRTALFEGIPNTVNKLNENKIKVLIFKNPPTLNYSIKNIRKDISQIEVSYEEYKNKNFFTDEIFVNLKNIKIFDPSNKLCQEKDKKCIVKLNDQDIYLDRTHLSEFGALLFYEEISLVVKKMLLK
jgi:hypothetical protein